MTTHPRLIIKNGREKSLRRRHPWVFSGAVERVEGDPGSGETVEIVDGRGAFLAWAAFSPASQIRARVWSFAAEEPADRALIGRRIAGAIEARRAFGLLSAHEACRLVYAESDGLPGLIVDRYASHLVCQFLAAGAEYWREAIIAELGRRLEPLGIYERSETSARRKEGLPARRGVLLGSEPPAGLEYRSGGLRRVVDLAHGQKTGGYLDQQLNRARVARYAAGARVLDVFAYTGGFGMACLAAGALEATLLESSADALRHAAEEAELNGLSARCGYLQADVFAELRALKASGRRFDLVVLDPPKFVHSAEQIPSGSRGYKDVNMLGLQLVAPGGTLATFSCSGHVDELLFQKIVAGAALDAGRGAQIVERFGQPPDHPIALEFPEAQYLNGLMLRVS